MIEYRITAKLPRKHLWYGSYFRELILDYFRLDGPSITDECRLCYADDCITHAYILDGHVIRWLFDDFGEYIFSINKMRNTIVPKCHVVDSDEFSYEVILKTPSDVDGDASERLCYEPYIANGEVPDWPNLHGYGFQPH